MVGLVSAFKFSVDGLARWAADGIAAAPPAAADAAGGLAGSDRLWSRLDSLDSRQGESLSQQMDKVLHHF